MSIIIHGVNASPFVRKVRVALIEKNIPYALKPQMPFGQPPEYMKISPLGKIPCLQDGDYALPDSSCIIAYLERTNPKPALYPEDPKEYGRALFLEEYADSKLVETLGPVFFQRVVRKVIFKQESDEDDRAQQDRRGGAQGLRLAREPDRRPRVAGGHAIRNRRHRGGFAVRELRPRGRIGGRGALAAAGGLPGARACAPVLQGPDRGRAPGLQGGRR